MQQTYPTGFYQQQQEEPGRNWPVLIGLVWLVIVLAVALVIVYVAVPVVNDYWIWHHCANVTADTMLCRN